MKKIAAAILFLTASNAMNAQDSIPLYPKVGPPGALVAHNMETHVERANGSKMVTKDSDTTITAYFPAKGTGNGTAILVCPGGGYGELAIRHEGYQVAEAFAKLGVAAFVLKYRLPDD